MTHVRTEVVIVHGMGEQLPLATRSRFVKTALPTVDGRRRHFSRPERVTTSYESRRHLAWRQPPDGTAVYGQTEFFEYHRSYLMTGNELSDLTPTLCRIACLDFRPRLPCFDEGHHNSCGSFRSIWSARTSRLKSAIRRRYPHSRLPIAGFDDASLRARRASILTVDVPYPPRFQRHQCGASWLWQMRLHPSLTTPEVEDG